MADLRRSVVYAVLAPDRRSGKEFSKNTVTKDDSLIMLSEAAVL